MTVDDGAVSCFLLIFVVIWISDFYGRDVGYHCFVWVRCVPDGVEVGDGEVCCIFSHVIGAHQDYC